jgi:poly(3-hydroxyalkanoate) synthetase
MNGPPPRRGPRPLPLHLAMAGLRAWVALATSGFAPPLAPVGRGPPGQRMSPPCSAGSTSWNGAWPRSSAGRAEAARIAQALAAGGHRPEAFQAAVLQALLRQDRALLAGIAAYRRYGIGDGPEPCVEKGAGKGSGPAGRPADPVPKELWREGSARLLDYRGTSPGGVPALFVPSLVNRATVLDLLPDASMLRWLATEGGLRPMLLDWGWPGEEERTFTLTDIVAGRLERAMAAACAHVGGPIALVGYCMGGLLALAAALRRPDRVEALALLATPWDFWAGGAEDAARARSLGGWLPAFEPLLEASGTLPVDAIQLLFAGLDPFSIAAKYRDFRRLDPETQLTRRFVALEDWLNDGVPLPAPIARECLDGWYGRNTPAREAWRVAGLPVRPREWAGPTFLAIPARDRIVPPASASALAAALPQAVVHRPAAGHIGMVAGGRAEAALWRPLAGWLGAAMR